MHCSQYLHTDLEPHDTQLAQTGNCQSALPNCSHYSLLALNLALFVCCFNIPYINSVTVSHNFFMVLVHPSSYMMSPVLLTSFGIVRLCLASVAELTSMSSRGGTHSWLAACSTLQRKGSRGGIGDCPLT
jgi:hypothetical protein